MKDNIICTNIRFNIDNTLHQKAWEYLQISPSVAQNPISSSESNTENEEIDLDFIGKS